MGFDDDRQPLLFLDNLQNESCRAKVRVHFGIEATNSIFVVLVLTRNVLGTQLQKRQDAFWSRCLVRGLDRPRRAIQAQRPVGVLGDSVVLRQNRGQQQGSDVFQNSSNGGTWESRRACVSGLRYHGWNRGLNKVRRGEILILDSLTWC